MELKHAKILHESQQRGHITQADLFFFHALYPGLKGELALMRKTTVTGLIEQVSECMVTGYELQTAIARTISRDV